MYGLLGFLAALGCVPPALAAPLTTPQKSAYIDWRTFQANGVNLGGWLEQESTIDSHFWATYSGGASDEWGLCMHLGSQCGPVLEHRYATWITKEDIDKLASGGVRILRIPTTYAAWLKVPGSQLYSGNQTAYIKEIADYAISTYDMHIIIDTHSLPGGTNGLTIGEATGHWDWFYNETNFNYSMQVIEKVIDFVQKSDSPQSYTIEPINEPADNNTNMIVFGTPVALTDHGAAWVLKYIKAVVQKVASVNPKIPVMFQGSFKYPQYWEGDFPADTNLVFDVHNYYFENRPTSSANLPEFLYSDARTKSGSGKFPVFVGEWSIQATYNNSFALRKRNVNTGLAAFGEYTQGSSYWTAKYSGNTSVDGQGEQRDYWNYEAFIDAGYFE
ncbi:glycoside hydrolase [Aspergillus sclerotioniger CBS 115572]|uniref:glucan 1,3-beta-glucosidase n=1 Tax=Aspergillus sclerotioniger CBS 115572 TaxID=1450535 RepID=A0A317W9H0_9EURO|nr:glycoside hydrolase [Aspergillus sclerotioniger CBS 115572]PWY83264.1 glycoside hydrolase [Aspergillus sclerotioniger CBS 115572]